jgi:hypothetical protein
MLLGHSLVIRVLPPEAQIALEEPLPQRQAVCRWDTDYDDSVTSRMRSDATRGVSDEHWNSEDRDSPACFLSSSP